MGQMGLFKSVASGTAGSGTTPESFTHTVIRAKLNLLVRDDFREMFQCLP